MARNEQLLEPNEAVLRGIEDDAATYVFEALQSWARTLFRGLSTVTAYQALSRLDDPAIRIPLTDALIDVLRDVAYMGVDIGRQHNELALGTSTRKAINAMVDYDEVNTDVLQWAIQYGYSLVGGLTETTKTALALEIQRFVTSGEPLPKLVSRLSNPDTGLFSKARAQRIAATEVTRAYAQGNMEAWKAGGIVEKRRWKTAQDAIVAKCRICAPMHNKVTTLNDPFDGPFGPIDIPAHVACRCVMVPYVEITIPDGWQPKYVKVRFS